MPELKSTERKMLKITFRVVGLYCYLPVLYLDDVTPSSTVKEVMDSIAKKYPAFSYEGGTDVHTISYDYTNNSVRPPNTMKTPDDGPRDLSESLGKTSLVWQYYRSVTVPINGTNFEIKIISPGQPPFAQQPLNADLILPPGSSSDICYNLTWRLVQIQVAPEALKKRLERRQQFLAKQGI
ncbi:hypothetical protein [Niveispirillum sp. BGYR6]|uniref:hypothetical protein n=1 Tax=Niveispirillum sp. BGYR6 TaxID=2971249 RepID=UPI0022B9D15C|nr:hypothetical protein [Niveispirillum sp. BGYR6]MDG5495130.1 hypothetical protein [Niveispirillum sp. BGYR6]